MSPILLTVEQKAAIAQREASVCLAGCDGVGKYATHRIVALIGDDALTEIHHTAALGLYPPPSFSEVADGTAARLVGNQRLQMLLRIAAGQVEQ